MADPSEHMICLCHVFLTWFLCRQFFPRANPPPGVVVGGTVLTAGIYTISVPGGQDMGSFSVSLNFPASFDWTNWAAQYTGGQKDLGTIEPGRLANLVILDKDYMPIPEDAISEIWVEMALIEGKVIYNVPNRRWRRSAPQESGGLFPWTRWR